MKAVYPGSFDPFTNGHLEILNQAIPLFGKITLAVAVNPEKPNSMFGLEDRLAFLRDIASEAMHSEKIEQYIQIAVGSYPVKGPGALYTVDYAESVGATHIIRGLRNGSDFEYEFAMAQINKGLNPKIRTVFFMADTDVSSVSSSMVRGLIGPQGWENAVKEYIPMCMWERFFKLVV
jgi:pantetheine-phosphate adenylyltransferase/8-oxo-dGTP diphosphatase